jgi:hypothetical protein
MILRSASTLFRFARMNRYMGTVGDRRRARDSRLLAARVKYDLAHFRLSAHDSPPAMKTCRRLGTSARRNRGKIPAGDGA